MTNTPRHLRVTSDERGAAGAAGQASADTETAAPARAAGDDPAEDAQARATSGAAIISVLTLVSRLTGFVRTWAQAYAMGATIMASCYSLANNLPNLLYDLVAAGMLSTAFLPVYMQLKRQAGRRQATEYASNLVCVLIVFMGALSLLGIVFAAQLVWTQSFSAASDFDFDLATYFTRFFVIEILLYALSTVFSGILNAERDYFWGAVAPIANNAVTIASFLAYAALADTDPELGLLLLALGNPLGVAAQVLICVIPLPRRGIHLRWRLDLSDPSLRETVSLGVPALLITACSFVATSVQNSTQLSVTASASAISSYARLWYTLPYAILTIPITTTLFTELSDSWSRRDLGAFRSGSSRGISQVLFFMVPFALYLMVFSRPLVSVISAGKFTSEQMEMTVGFLLGLSVGLPAYSLGMYLQKVCSAMHDMRTISWANVLGTLVQVGLLVTLTPVLGLTFSASTTLWFFVVVDVMVLASLHRKLGSLGLGRIVGSTLRILALGVLGALVGAAVLWALDTYVGDCTGTVVRAALYCACGGIPAVCVTYGLAALLRVPEASLLKTLARRLLRR